MKTALFILAALVLYTCAQKKMGDNCRTNADCEDGCCAKMGGKMRCQMKAMNGEKCDRKGIAKDACMCRDNLMCVPDALLDMKYGICKEIV